MDLENLQNFWYVAGLSDSLRQAPLARTIVNHPIVLFRDPAGQAHALLDRCCHRNMPLSFGKVTPKGVQCGYHGWEFAPGGQCVRIPGQPPESKDTARGRVPSFPVIEQDGLLWVYATPDAKPTSRPFPIPFSDDRMYGTLRVDFGLMQASVENIIDNFMDSLHPPFIHAGLIYDDKKRNRLEIEVRPYQHPEGHRGVEGCYLGEPPPTQGLIGRIFADRSANIVVHEERYIAPSLTQAEYRIGTSQYLQSSHLFTPETPTRTRMYLLLRTKSRIPKPVSHLILRALFTKLFKQDIRALEIQQRAEEQPGLLPRASSELDILSLAVIRYLRELAQGKSLDTIHVKSHRYTACI